ncbi:MAG: alpha/beta fold hydrolase [Chloroflexota bacterium]|nr:alpha/beta fold hydrolase [Chloroflexota bacterium]
MAQRAYLDPSPFHFSGGPTGVLLIHGFTGAPTEMRQLGENLAEDGYTVLCPLLPGHGTEPADLNQVRWQDWFAVVTRSFEELASQVDRVFVAGLSLGGLLTLHLAANQPDIQGLLLFAPGLRISDRKLPLTSIGRYFLAFLPQEDPLPVAAQDEEGSNLYWCYDVIPVAGANEVWRLQRTVRPELRRVTQPLILFQGKEDTTIRSDNPSKIVEGVSSLDTRIVWLENSGHNLLVDVERQMVFEQCLRWIRQHGDPE